MTASDNELITRVEGRRPAGRLLSLYWQPIALVEELEGPRPVRPVRLFGRELVLFRTADGYGLLDRDCPHRGADLAFGRLEPAGLRCTFHGWLFNGKGECLETPAEPIGSTLCKHIRQGAYPVVERSGVIFAYLGEGEPPAFPSIDCLTAPNAYTFAFKGHLECNWLQALEVGIDPGHASYLHRFFEDEDPASSYGRQFRDVSANSNLPITQVLREHDQPTINVEETDFGLRLETLRDLGGGATHVRVTNLLFPQAFVIPMSPEVTITQWHVPIDDVNTYWYAIFTSYAEPLDKAQMRAQRLELYTLPDYRSRRNKRNNYLFDAEEQASQTFTGMGHDINVHDQWAVESQGPIQDRTREHLGQSDKGVVAYRRQLKKAIKAAEDGERPFMVIDEADAAALSAPASIDIVVPEGDWKTYWRQAEQDRRDGAAWRKGEAKA
jgi:phenylpropionate dioxygenase-like ring-hydroxylating dioxygenase large terminal subunit